MELNELNLSEEQLANVQKLLQSHEDRIRTDYSKKLKDAETELAKYKPLEKSESEKKLEERIAALEAKEQELANKERAMTIAEKLKAKDLPQDLAKFLNVTDDMDSTIEEVAKMFGGHFSTRPTSQLTMLQIVDSPKRISRKCLMQNVQRFIRKIHNYMKHLVSRGND